MHAVPHDHSPPDFFSILLARRRELLAEEASAQLAIEHELSEIRSAIQRIEHGTYGTCETCNGPIPLQRLERIPYARCCMECQKEFEQNLARRGWDGTWS